MILNRSSALLAAAAMIGALTLSGCGRKGGLDAPPAASAAADQAVVEEGVVARDGGATGLPLIRGPRKRIPLDALLD